MQNNRVNATNPLSIGVLLVDPIITHSYSAELSVKVKRGQKENALKCKANGGMVPFGYRVNSERYYEVDPLTAPIVLEIFERYADGQTVGEISDELNGRGVFTNTKYKYTNKSSFHNLLKNRRYIGEYRYGDTVVPDGMPAIVSEDIFERVQERMEKNRHKPAAMKADEEYILTTKLFCGKCGTMMVGVGGTSKTGRVHHYYKCGNRIYKKSCDKKTVRKEWIERAVVTLTREFVLRDEVIERLADAVVELQKQENTTIPFLQKQLGDVNKRIGNMLNAIEEGLMNASAKERLDALEEKKADLEIALAKEKIEKPPLSREQIIFWISKFKDGDIDDIEYRKSIVDVFVNAIFLYEDKLMIAFNYKDGTKTVTLAELEAAVNDAGSGETPPNSVLSGGSFLDGHAPPVFCRKKSKHLCIRLLSFSTGCSKYMREQETLFMILSDKTIHEMLQDKRLTISPLEKDQVQPASVDIHLGNTYAIVEDSSDEIVRLENRAQYKTITADKYLLLPGQFALATTMEYFKLPDNLTAFVEGRSSIGRLGLFIQNAGWVDPEFEGEITLELYNANRCEINYKPDGVSVNWYLHALMRMH